jgi:hypothetical protein
MAASTSNVTQKAYLVNKIKSTNYSIWNIKMETLLSLNKAFFVVDGSKPNPGTVIPATQLAHWKIKDGKAHADIILHCGDRQIQLLKSL